MKILPAAALVLLTLSAPAFGWGWLSAPPEEAESQPAPLAFDGGEDGACIAAILAAGERYDIPGHLLLALGLQEAGWQGPRGLTIWPWTVNAGGDGRRFTTRAEAETFVRRKQAEGVTLIDVGCLQINLRWHPDAFATLSQGFDPTANIDYAARFLRSLYEESGDWWQAAGRYHSRSEGPQATYLAGLARNQKVVTARLDHLLTLAGGGFAGGYDAPPLAPAAPNYRTEGAIWGAELSGDEGALRTLYSAEDLQPVLPDFMSPEI